MAVLDTYIVLANASSDDREILVACRVQQEFVANFLFRGMVPATSGGFMPRRVQVTKNMLPARKSIHEGATARQQSASRPCTLELDGVRLDGAPLGVCTGSCRCVVVDSLLAAATAPKVSRRLHLGRRPWIFWRPDLAPLVPWITTRQFSPTRRVLRSLGAVFGGHGWACFDRSCR